MVGFEFDSTTTELVSKCITQAETEVNKFLARRYNVSDWAATTTSVPPMVTTLTEWYATGLSMKSLSRGNKELLSVANDYLKMAKDNLIEIVENKADLVDSDGDPVAESAIGAFRVLSNTKNYSPTFNEDADLNQRVDQEKLDDIRDERD